jgi:hypothetical protein
MTMYLLIAGLFQLAACGQQEAMHTELVSRPMTNDAERDLMIVLCSDEIGKATTAECRNAVNAESNIFAHGREFYRRGGRLVRPKPLVAD